MKERDHSEDLGVYGRVILCWILGKYGENLCIGLSWLRIAESGGPI
jgi:hypothetical protein